MRRALATRRGRYFLLYCYHAILSEYERWSKKHPDDATMMGGFLFAGDDG